MSFNQFISKNLSSLQLRILSSFVIVPVFILSIYFGGIVFFALIGGLLFISYEEWIKMAAKSPTEKKDCTYGSAYLAIGLGALCLLRIVPDNAAFVTLALLFIIWACDTGAFFTGKIVGGKKLCPSISPGKTWAGLIGGVTAGGIVGYACHSLLGIYNSIPAAIFIGLLIALTGQAGDLIMSKYKRYVGVKDTGTIIPGHGGILDRIDSLLLAAPVYLILIFYFHESM